MGTSLPAKVLAVCNKDHPHACGDKHNSLATFSRLLGSSPRVWGQAFLSINGVSSFRIIPTRVGTRILKTLRPRLSWDHPHACGDKTWNTSPRKRALGSSPRVWGQASSNHCARVTDLIIPTRVGTSLINGGSFFSPRDHPHACGDKENWLPSHLFLSGSSPRVWGQALIKITILLSDRIIPTRVGTRSQDLRRNKM